MAELGIVRSIAIAMSMSTATASSGQALKIVGPPQALVTGASVSDFDWIRQRYQQDAKSRRAWAQLVADARSTAKRRTSAERAAARKYGVELQPPAFEHCYGDERCDWILQTDRVADKFESWQTFSQAWMEARAVAIAVSLLAAQAEDSVRRALPESGIESELHARFTRDQLLRRAYSDPSIPLSEGGRQLFALVVGRLIARADRENTVWLRQMVERSGWPRSGQLRRESEMAAWFMLVHARSDPVFQLQVLERMAKKVERGEIGRAQYATRVDHILFEATGRQRYGTQGFCNAAKFVPRPSEAPGRVPELRRQMGLPTLQEQEQLMSAACAASR